MTAVVKHISVHPEYRRCRVVGIFDDVDNKDSRQANLDRHRANKENARQKVFRNADALNWGNSISFQYTKRSEIQPWPENHCLAGISDAELNRMLDSMPDQPTE